MIQNTSETRETIMRYTIPQIESIVKAISENSNVENTDSNTLEGADALKFLISNGGKL
jgi:hypothetical protein